MKNIREAGLRWERELAKALGGKRQPSSGAFGTQIHDASLTGDVVVNGLRKLGKRPNYLIVTLWWP